VSELGDSGTKRSAWTVLAAAILTLLALPFGAFGASLLNEVMVRGHVPGGSGGVFEVMVGSGVGLLIVAAIHVWAAVSTWREPVRSGSPGRLVGWAGVVLGSVAFGLSLIGAADVAPIVLAFPLAYGAILVCLRNSARDSQEPAAIGGPSR
jgi:hypothetical protein